MKEVYTLNIDVSKLKEALGDTKNLKQLFDKIGFDLGNIDDANKKLKEQNKILNNSLKVLNLIKIAGKGIMFGLGALGLSGYAITSAYRGAVSQNRQGRQAGLSLTGMKRWEYAEEQLGTDGSLLSFLSNIKYMMNDPTKQTPFASMGWNAEEMKKMSPEQLMTYMLDSIKEMGEKMPQNLLEENLAKMGFDLQSNWDILEDGSKNFRKYIEEAGDILPRNYNNMVEGERAMNKLKNAVNELRLNIATKVVPILSIFVEKLTPIIDVLSEKFGGVVEGATEWATEKAPNGKSNLENLIDKIVKTLTDIWHTISNIWNWFTENEVLWESVRDLGSWVAGMLGRSDKQEAMHNEAKDKFKSLKGGLLDFKKFSPDEAIQYRDWLTANKGSFLKQDYQKLLEQYDSFIRTKAGSSANYNRLKVNDAIITKDGKVIQTHPEDNIIATKNLPNNANTFNININAVVRNDRDINRIKMELGTLFNQINMGGTI